MSVEPVGSSRCFGGNESCSPAAANMVGADYGRPSGYAGKRGVSVERFGLDRCFRGSE